MSKKKTDVKAGHEWYAALGLKRKSVYAREYIWGRYERAARKKKWKLRSFMTWFLSKNAPK